ncbi:MAG TPA: O-antigen ligase family protein [Bacteroidales bacterium]|nr:O-antigen ligase family protein [Bacteroidales bacterium]
MKKTKKKTSKKTAHEPSIKPIDFLFGLIIFGYIFIPTFTPNWMSLDTNTPKFFMTATLNLVVFVVFLFSPVLKNHRLADRFFLNPIGLVYSGFLLVSLLSFTQSINILESVLQFTKLFTIFASVFNLSIILMHNLKYVRLIIVTMTALLIFDSISVFVNINKFIIGEIEAISDIKTVYSNKNILASAIYVKLPFALWLLVFDRKWLRVFGWFAITLGITATFFMATRAFYLGLLIISIVFISYNIIVYIRQKQQTALMLAGVYIGSIIIGLGIFNFTQANLYPKKKKSRHTQSVVAQLSTLKNPESASSLRLDAWRWSWELIKEKPLLGVGSGNWKVDILKYENQKNPGFIYLYKAHNDFIETTAETGIFGGLLFMGIFLLIISLFIRHYFNKTNDPEKLHQFLFLAATGVTFYAVDAFFNFPADRPEITALFAFFVSAGIATSYHDQNTESNYVMRNRQIFGFRPVRIVASIIGILFLAASVWLLYLNFQSSKTQRIVYQEIMQGKLKEPSAKIIAGFPWMPDVSVWGESIETLKARYLINEEKYEEALDILYTDHSSPYDARREFFMAMAFNNMKQYDSALYYSKIAYQLKPNYLRNIQMYTSLLERSGDTDSIPYIYERFLAKNKKESQAFLLASNYYIQNNNLEKANEIVNQALKYHPQDTLVQKQHRFLRHKLEIEPNLHFFNEAAEHYKAKKYDKVIPLLDKFIAIVPDYPNAYQIRSFSHYYLKNYEKSIEDADQALKLGPANSSLINLRGVCKLELKMKDEACKDFRKSADMGDKSGTSNFQRFCGNK